jgi:hypothetical protein
MQKLGPAVPPRISFDLTAFFSTTMEKWQIIATSSYREFPCERNPAETKPFLPGHTHPTALNLFFLIGTLVAS